MNMPDTRQSYLVISIHQGRFMANLVQITQIVLEDMKVLTYTYAQTHIYCHDIKASLAV